MVLWLFFKTWIAAVFFNRKPSELIIDDLLNKFTFRYKPAQQEKLRTLFIFFRTAFKNCWHPTIIKEYSDKDFFTSELLIYDSRYEYQNRKRYLSYLKIPPFVYLSRNYVHFVPSFFWKLSISFQLFLLFPVLFVVALFKKNRGNLALLSCELVETSFLLYHIKQMPKLRQVMLFSAYEKDCNFVSHLLRKYGLKVQVVPSQTPIKNFYKKGICTTFTLTAPYHKNEFELLKQDWIYEASVFWPPFGYEEVVPRITTYKTPPPNTIGFFSSGSWLRDKLGYPTGGFNEREAEHLLVKCLVNYFQSHPDKKLIIFLHPLEKRTKENLEQSLAYYKNLFGNDVEFAPFDSNSVASFDLVDLGVAGYSSTVFQRLFAARKTLLAPFAMPSDYFSDPHLEAISIRSEEQFNSLITTVLDLSPTAFFEGFQLQAYTHDAYTDVLNLRQVEHEQH